MISFIMLYTFSTNFSVIIWLLTVHGKHRVLCDQRCDLGQGTRALWVSVYPITHEDFDVNGLEVSSLRRAWCSSEIVRCAVLHATNTENFFYNILWQVRIEGKGGQEPAGVDRRSAILPFILQVPTQKFPPPRNFSLALGRFLFIHYYFSPWNHALVIPLNV